MVEDHDAERAQPLRPQHGNLDAVVGERNEEVLDDERTGPIAGDNDERRGRRDQQCEDTEDDSFRHFRQRCI